MSQIQELFAWIVDDPTGMHGIIAFRTEDGTLAQAVTSKRHVADTFAGPAQLVAQMTGLPVRLQRFVLVETVDTV